MLAGALAAVGWRRAGQTDADLPEQENPAEMRPALLFGLIYALVVLAVAAARTYAGSSGLFLVAGVSGLVNMDAITLSTARLVEEGTLDGLAAFRMIMTGAIANLLFKAVIVGMMGTRQLLKEVLPPFAVIAAVGVLLIAAG